MSDTDKEQDNLLIPIEPGSDVEFLTDKGFLPYQVQEIRNVVQDFDASKLDKYNDGLIYDAYQAALNSDGFTKHSIYKNLGISKRLFDYYMQAYPRFNVAINTGLADKQETLKSSVIERLMALAKGMELENTEEIEEESFDADGKSMGTRKKKVIKKTKIPPDTKAVMSLLTKLDASWNPTVQLDVSGEVTNTNIDVTANVDISVDYKKLSPTALKELLSAQKTARVDNVETLEVSKRIPSDLIETSKSYAASKTTSHLDKKEKEIENIKQKDKQRVKKLLLGGKQNGDKRND